jgi:hypothetical protein
VDAVNLLERIEKAHDRPALRGWGKAARWFLAAIFLVPGLEKLSGELFRRAANKPGLLPFFEALPTGRDYVPGFIARKPGNMSRSN